VENLLLSSWCIKRYLSGVAEPLFAHIEASEDNKSGSRDFEEIGEESLKT
jgi:hypothetical protein